MDGYSGRDGCGAASVPDGRPLGALIGGAAGFGIGIGEMIAGVKSPQREATMTSRASTVSIFPEQRHDQAVVQIAQSQFGGQIAVAVRSPSVRQLVMLYSEATARNAAIGHDAIRR